MDKNPKDTNVTNATQDLPDSPQDKEKMRSETIIMDLPEIKDIPGQEHVHVAPLGELADTTISSDDEEGAGVLDDEGEDDMDDEPDITIEEENILDDAGIAIADDEHLRAGNLDSTDEDGEPLNEGGMESAVSGSDLDVPGTGDDDANEEIGEEDEENNNYSLGGDREDEERKD